MANSYFSYTFTSNGSGGINPVCLAQRSICLSKASSFSIFAVSPNASASSLSFLKRSTVLRNSHNIRIIWRFASSLFILKHLNENPIHEPKDVLCWHPRTPAVSHPPTYLHHPHSPTSVKPYGGQDISCISKKPQQQKELVLLSCP